MAPLVAELFEVTRRVGAGREAAGVTPDEIVGTLDLEATLTRGADDDVVARMETSFA
jgi:hypothetical protein